MKIAPIMRVMAQKPERYDQVLIHTGQHYDENMSRIFFEELSLPKPEINLGVGSGSHAWQTGQVMTLFEPILLEQKPDLVIVVGDVNSTLACALVCAKLSIPVAHVEAGLRSYDRTMPEEINRLLTDQISNLLFTHSRHADKNLLREGISADKIHFVGNVMIDTLVQLKPLAEERWPVLRDQLNLDRFILVTLHRPFNVDNPHRLAGILAALVEVSDAASVLFPVHPRSKKVIYDHNLEPKQGDVRLIEPLGYLDFLALMGRASMVLTDSGGIQEETTYLGVPCLTARPNTERPITVTSGSNILVDSEREPLLRAMQDALGEDAGPWEIPELWDGHAAERIVQVLEGTTLEK
jgi:UDP-N-acetylglucosamine 2-epimerase (non-hydrolysing)